MPDETRSDDETAEPGAIKVSPTGDVVIGVPVASVIVEPTTDDEEEGR